jgi:hypothetical protein
VEEDKAWSAWAHHGVKTIKPIFKQWHVIEPGVYLTVSPNQLLFQLEHLI